MKVVLTICAVISTLCLVYFVLANEMGGCLLDANNLFCRTAMSIFPDDPENVVLKHFRKHNQDDP